MGRAGHEMTLAALKRMIEAGATLTLRSYETETSEGWAPMRHKYQGVPRRADRCQTASVRLQPGESWLSYGRAGSWTFEEIEGGVLATMTDEGDGYYGARLVYEVTP